MIPATISSIGELVSCTVSYRLDTTLTICMLKLVEALQQLGMVCMSRTHTSDWLTYSPMLIHTHTHTHTQLIQDRCGETCGWMYDLAVCAHCLFMNTSISYNVQHRTNVQLAIDLTLNSCGEFEFIKFTD